MTVASTFKNLSTQLRVRMGRGVRSGGVGHPPARQASSARTLLTAGLAAGAMAAATAMPGAAVPSEPAPLPVDLIDASSRTGLSVDAAAASCWEIKQLHPDSP